MHGKISKPERVFEDSFRPHGFHGGGYQVGEPREPFVRYNRFILYNLTLKTVYPSRRVQLCFLGWGFCNLFMLVSLQSHPLEEFPCLHSFGSSAMESVWVKCKIMQDLQDLGSHRSHPHLNHVRWLAGILWPSKWSWKSGQTLPLEVRHFPGEMWQLSTAFQERHIEHFRSWWSLELFAWIKGGTRAVAERVWLGVALSGVRYGFCAAARIGFRKSGFRNCVLWQPASSARFWDREPGLGNQVRERGYGTGAQASSVGNQVFGVSWKGLAAGSVNQGVVMLLGIPRDLRFSEHLSALVLQSVSFNQMTLSYFIHFKDSSRHAQFVHMKHNVNRRFQSLNPTTGWGAARSSMWPLEHRELEVPVCVLPVMSSLGCSVVAPGWAVGRWEFFFGPTVFFVSKAGKAERGCPTWSSTTCKRPFEQIRGHLFQVPRTWRVFSTSDVVPTVPPKYLWGAPPLQGF